MTELLQVGTGFKINGEPFSCEPYGTGHIHETYLLKSGDTNTPSSYILQLLNIDVFRKPEAVQDNIHRILTYLKDLPDKQSDFQELEIVDTINDTSLHIDRFGNHWRCFNFIENSVTLERVENPEQAFEGGRGFGLFAAMLKDYNPRRLHITIPHFMDAEWRMQQLTYTEFINPGERLKQVQPELKKIRQLSDISSRFLRIRTALPERVTHNDTKITNLLFDSDTGKAKCVIDLDTVMTGTLLTDFGDMVRSYTASGKEDGTGPDSWDCREDIFEALINGFAEAVSTILLDVETSNLLLGAKLVIYMQAVRFLTDYLKGDIYYKTAYPEHNRDRARNQIGLLESLISKEDLLQDILKRSII